MQQHVLDLQHVLIALFSSLCCVCIYIYILYNVCEQMSTNQIVLMQLLDLDSQKWWKRKTHRHSVTANLIAKRRGVWKVWWVKINFNFVDCSPSLKN